MDVNELQSLKIKDLTKLAKDLKIESISGLNKQELVVQIIKADAKEDDALHSRGTLEVLPDGYGFLRSPDSNYLPGPNDIYVSPSQIKRFGLKTGHEVAGEIRPPKSKERFYALLKVDTVNDRPPEDVRNVMLFDNLIPLHPDEKLTLETEQKNLSMRIMDLMCPVGRGQRVMIVAQPKTCKTILLQQIANSIRKNHPKTKMIILLIDERP